MATIFTRIVKGEIPCYKIAENNRFLAFLDINPLAKGHTLVIPKMEVDYIFDLPTEEYLGLMLFAKEVAAKVEKAVECERIGLAVIGLEVPHAHIHLVPLKSEKDINFANQKLKLAPEEFELIAKNIRGE